MPPARPTARALHDGQLELAPADVARLLTAQFPQWASEPIVRVPSDGTVNAMFRVGDDKVARLPFVAAGAPDIPREAETLARLQGALTAPIPRVLEVGAPDDAYPYAWSVLQWTPGRVPAPRSLPDADGVADDLALFLSELRAVDATGATAGYRGGPLARLDSAVRRWVGDIGDLVDTATLMSIWDDALAAGPWRDDPVWVHGDLLPSNLLVDENGRLAGVIDWAFAGVGDPACELMAAWNLLPARSRGRLRERLGVDDDTWRRGRGWALAQAVIALPYYRHTSPGMSRMALHALRALLERP